jgi:hypothetical protein
VLPPVTDQLEDRGKQREARAAAGAEGTAAQPQTPEAARDLLNGLITGSETDDAASTRRCARPREEREIRTGARGRTRDAVDAWRGRPRISCVVSSRAPPREAARPRPPRRGERRVRPTCHPAAQPSGDASGSQRST